MDILGSKYFSWKENNESVASLKSALEWQFGPMKLILHLINYKEWFYFAETFLISFQMQCISGLSDLKQPTFEMLKHHKRMPSSDQLISSTSKVGRVAATDLSWLSMYSYKKDRTQRGPLKACWLGAQWDKNTNCGVFQWFWSSIPSLCVAMLRILSWGGLLSGVGGGQKAFRRCELLLFFFYILHFPDCLSHLRLWRRGAGLPWFSISHWIPPQNPA